MKTKTAIFSAIFALIAIGCDVHHHHDDAHAHGIVHLNIIIDSDHSAHFELRMPGMDAVGFEHRATSDEDQAKVAAVKEQLEQGIAELVVFDPHLDCRYAKVKIELVFDGHDHGHSAEHSDLHAEFKVECSGVIPGSRMVVDLQPAFASLEQVNATVLSDNLQDSRVLHNAQGVVPL